MNLRKQSEIDRLNRLFAETGGEASNLPPPVNQQEAAMLAQEAGTVLFEKRTFETPEQCGKVSYPSFDTAKRVMRSRQRHGASRLRIYSCPDCKGFHLTSSV